MSQNNNGWMVYLEPLKPGIPNRAVNAGEGLTNMASLMDNTAERCLADVDKKITFRPDDHDEYSCRLRIQNVTQADSIIYKIKTTSPEHYRARPCIALIEPGCSAKVPVNSNPGVTPSAIQRDRFEVQVCILPKDMMNGENCDCESSHNSHFSDLNDIFKRLVNLPDIPVETFRVSVGVEPRMGGLDTGRGIMRVDGGAGRFTPGDYDLREKTSESVYKKLDRIHMLTSAILYIILGMCIAFAIVWLMQGMGELSESECRRACPGFIPVSECANGNDLNAPCQGGLFN